MTDQWAAYNTLQNHITVNHSLHFRDPANPDAYTNTVEGMWGNCKAKFRAMHGTSDGLFETYLQEFMWRRTFPKRQFGHILFWICHYYPC